MALKSIEPRRLSGRFRPRAKSASSEIGLRTLLAGLLIGLVALLILPAFAVGGCFPIAQRGGNLLHRAAYAPRLALDPGTVSLTYLGHASFLLETPAGVSAVTDYNGYIRPSFTPDIVTMNNAHPTHYTDNPDPEIKYVLRGWDEGERLARYNLQVKDLVVRNVPTNVRDFGGTTRYNGNSIFIFETANLCIAHLGHLQHTLTDVQLGELGQIDVLLAPVDGAYTMSQFDMIDVIRQISARLVIPMHFFTPQTLERFLARLGETHTVKVSESPTLMLSRAMLPRGKPEVLVLPGH